MGTAICRPVEILSVPDYNLLQIMFLVFLHDVMRYIEY